MKHVSVYILLFITSISFGQEGETLYPKIGELLEFNLASEKLIPIRNELYQKGGNISSQEQAQLDSINNIIGERYYDENIYETQDAGCSWYCAGGPYKITASSYLKSSSNTTNYKPDNIHDFSYETVWSEGVKGYGIGEYLEYYFKSHPTLQVTEIRIANGYVKNDNLWFANSRVKKIKLYYNNVPYAILELNDTKALQIFKLRKPIGITEGTQDWKLKFEILEVYKGDKHDDVVISEIFFDGIGDH